MNSDLSTKATCSTLMKKKGSDGIHALGKNTNQRNEQIRPFMRWAGYKAHQQLSSTSAQREQSTSSHSAQQYERNRATTGICTYESVNSESCYRWLMPRMINLRQGNEELDEQYLTSFPNRNRRMDSLLEPDSKEDVHQNIISVQPISRSCNRKGSSLNSRRPPWNAMPRTEYQRYFATQRTSKSTRTKTSRLSRKTGSSFSTSQSSTSRFFRSCPSCFGTSDSEGSDSSSSEEDEGGSDTENEDCERGNDDLDFGDGANSNISDQEDSSGGSDSENSEELFGLDLSGTSSLYDEDIMINEEKAFADVGQFESDDEFDFDHADGHGALSSDSFTDSDEFFRDSDDDRGNQYQENDRDYVEHTQDDYNSDF